MSQGLVISKRISVNGAHGAASNNRLFWGTVLCTKEAEREYMRWNMWNGISGLGYFGGLPSVKMATALMHHTYL